MALRKAITNNFGAESEYWRITELTLNPKKGIANITLSGYVNQAARDAHKEPMETKRIVIKNTDSPDGKSFSYKFDRYFSSTAMGKGGNIYQIMYRYIKENLGDFTDAEDA
jgi:hypothetical protein